MACGVLGMVPLNTAPTSTERVSFATSILTYTHPFGTCSLVCPDFIMFILVCWLEKQINCSSYAEMSAATDASSGLARKDGPKF
jgi:hypothetical protein